MQIAVSDKAHTLFQSLLAIPSSPVAAAKMLKKREASLRGTIIMIFQPGEEGGAGILLPC